MLFEVNLCWNLVYIKKCDLASGILSVCISFLGQQCARADGGELVQKFNDDIIKVISNFSRFNPSNTYSPFATAGRAYNNKGDSILKRMSTAYDTVFI